MNERRVGILYIVLAAVLWSTGGIGIKWVVDPPLKVTFYRSVFAAITLFFVVRRDVFGRRWTSTPVFATAIISYAACLTTFVTATKWTTAANAIFIQYSGVIWVMLLAPFVLAERMTKRDAIAITVALAGMALFFVGKFEARGMAGNGMAVLSSIFFATLVLALRREPNASRAAVTWGNVLLALVLLPFVADDLALSAKSFFALLFLGVFQIGFAYAAFVKGLRYVSATQASLTGMIEPVANPIWVALFLGEFPSIFAIIGGGIVLAAIGWHTLQGEPASELPAPD